MNTSLTDQLENLLPQTQCTKCGYPSCRAYADAMASAGALHNQCPPGGAVGIARLAKSLNKEPLPLNTIHGYERPRTVAFIEEEHCIGCTLCIQACPVDAILGAAKQMHTVLPDLCTGCDLCVAPCPVDCITMVNVSGMHTGWSAWSQTQADDAKARFQARNLRLKREEQENDARLAAKAAMKLAAINAEVSSTADEQIEKQRKQAIIAAAMERARLKKLGSDTKQ